MPSTVFPLMSNLVFFIKEPFVELYLMISFLLVTPIISLRFESTQTSPRWMNSSGPFPDGVAVISFLVKFKYL